jgi:cytochrome b involved in lipid metabolism
MSVIATAVLSEGSGGPFDLVNGIPVHPLVVHAAVVFVPLTALGMIAMAIWPRLSARLGWLVVASAVLATVFSFAAKESGEVLEGRVGEPGYDHAELGDVMPIFAGVLLIAVVALWLIDRSAPADGPAPRRGLRITVAIVGVLIALGNLVWVYRVGDSGAKSVWSGEVSASGSADGSGEEDESAEGADEDSDEDGATGESTAAPNAAAATTTIAMADLAAHGTQADCWVGIEGNVYDLTAYLDKHPGGSDKIVGLCGTDGTSAFTGEHGSEQKPAAVLAGAQIGVLG